MIGVLAIVATMIACAMFAWPEKADVVPMRRRKRIESYFSNDLGRLAPTDPQRDNLVPARGGHLVLERSGPRAEAGLKAHSDALTGKHHGREIKPATLRPVLLSRRSNGGAYVK